MLPKVRFPAGQGVDYYKAIKKLLKKAHAEVIEEYESRIVPLVKFKNDSTKYDEELEDISNILDEMRKTTFVLFFTDDKVEEMAEEFVKAIKTHSKNEFNKQIKKVKGVDPIGRNSSLESIINAAAKENVSYIKSIPEKYHNNLETVVLQGVRRGKSTDDIAKDIQHVYQVSDSKAKFIARDQAGSLMGDLTKKQHEDLGLETFVWSTSGDSKVRDSHKGLDGQVFKWSEGAKVRSGKSKKTIWPGTDFNCRCVAEVNEEELKKL